MNDIHILFLIFLISIPVVFLIGNMMESNRNDKLPIIETNATLVNKSVEKLSRDANRYYLTFETNDHERLKFKVDHHKYAMYIEKDVGELSYQGTRLIYFKRITD